MGLTAIELPEETTSTEPVCPVCGGLGYIKYDLPPTHPEFGRWHLCPETEWHASDRSARLINSSGLLEGERWTLERLAELEEDTTGMVELLCKWLSRPRGWLYLWGPFGTGKTVALQAAVYEFCLRGIPAYYSTFADLLDVMQGAFTPPQARRDEDMHGWQRHDTYLSRLRRLQRIPLLAIDEFEKHKETEWVKQFRTQLVDIRYRTAISDDKRARTYTLWAGNADPKSLPGYIWDRIDDNRFVVYHYTGESKRAKAMWYDDI
jgi:DNA replication protein DnaC